LVLAIRLGSHGVKIIPTGINFGTVLAFINKEVFEITTLRKDLLCDGRRAWRNSQRTVRQESCLMCTYTRFDINSNANKLEDLSDKIEFKSKTTQLQPAGSTGQYLSGKKYISIPDKIREGHAGKQIVLRYIKKCCIYGSGKYSLWRWFCLHEYF
jgi:hypothetical protein